LHGSYAIDMVKTGSDLDIGVLGKKLLDFKTVSSIYSDLSEIFGDNKNRELDLKSLHKIDPLFRYQVAKYSQLLYGNTIDYNEFRAYAFQQYHDSRNLFELEKKLVIKYQNHLNKKYIKNYA
jgi:predicted nucleotidyltransferase